MYDGNAVKLILDLVKDQNVDRILYLKTALDQQIAINEKLQELLLSDNPKSEIDKMEWQDAGIISVDAGLCWIGDPCYCVTPDADEHPAETWSGFCDVLFNQPGLPDITQWNFKNGHAGLGVSVSTGHGDGSYPVYVRKNLEGRVAEVRVVFIDSEVETNEGDS